MKNRENISRYMNHMKHQFKLAQSHLDFVIHGGGEFDEEYFMSYVEGIMETTGKLKGVFE